jgi:hypothetical protein
MTDHGGIWPNNWYNLKCGSNFENVLTLHGWILPNTSNAAVNVWYIWEFSLFVGELFQTVTIASNVAINICYIWEYLDFSWVNYAKCLLHLKILTLRGWIIPNGQYNLKCSNKCLLHLRMSWLFMGKFCQNLKCSSKCLLHLRILTLRVWIIPNVHNNLKCSNKCLLHFRMSWLFMLFMGEFCQNLKCSSKCLLHLRILTLRGWIIPNGQNNLKCSNKCLLHFRMSWLFMGEFCQNFKCSSKCLLHLRILTLRGCIQNHTFIIWDISNSHIEKSDTRFLR